jgi:hypothetical protein
MKGDFSRLTFDPGKRYTRVLMQQGRVQLDADWNEQAAILLHYLERLAADLIGPYGGPAGALGFGVAPEKDDNGTATGDFTIGAGRYYVDGLLAESLAGSGQPKPEKLPALLYLDLWERHVTFVEDEKIREVALEGADTATRAQVAWRVRLTSTLPDGKTAIPANLKVEERFQQWVDAFQPPNRGGLQARATVSGDPTEPCVASPDARYRGLQNQLYRVEIHTGGKAVVSPQPGATFKWSRDNGSVTFPVVDISPDSQTGTTAVTLEHLGHGSLADLAAGDWVEIVDGDLSLGLLPVATVEADRRRVTLTGIAQLGQDPPKSPLLRRWDHGRSKGIKPAKDGALPIQEGSDIWLELEDGVQVSFQPADNQTYRAGDYWLIPARTATGDVEWPQGPSPTAGQPPVPATLPPHGVRHRYAPLALLTADPAGSVKILDMRRSFKPLGA